MHWLIEQERQHAAIKLGPHYMEKFMDKLLDTGALVLKPRSLGISVSCPDVMPGSTSEMESWLEASR